MEVIFYTSRAFPLIIFLVSMVLALRDNQATKYFLWVWAVLMIPAPPLMNRANMISHIAAGLMLAFFLYALYITVRHGMERVDASHEKTRRALAESNRRIDEERCILARRLHNEMNPQLLLTRNVLKQLELLMAGNGRAAELLDNASGILNDAYAEMHDIIRDTRIEVIDSVSLAAALEPLVAHYTNISEKPAITLEHDLLKWPTIPEASAISAYKITREAIFSAIEHSKAVQVCASIHHSKALNIYKVEITGDGVGMRATARNGEHAGIRLIDMRE